MKNKRIKIIVIILILLILGFIVFLIVNRTIKNNKEPEVKKPEIVLTENSKVYKNIVLEVDSSFEYKEVDDYSFEIKKDNWKALLSPIYDKNHYILDYPKCTSIFFNTDNMKTIGDYSLIKNNGHDYIKFKTTNNDKTNNNLIVHYDLGKDYVMRISLVNAKNNFSESGLDEIIKILETAQINPEGTYDYYIYSPDFYHQCHDVNKLDEEDFNKTNKELEKQIKE